MILLDTNVVSEPMRPLPDVRVMAWLDGLDADMVGIPAVVLAELHAGLEVMADGRRKEALRLGIERMANEVCRGLIISFDEAAARLYGRLTAERDRAGRPMGIADCQIAAIALANKAQLATRDGGFADCGIAIINPWMLP